MHHNMGLHFYHLELPSFLSRLPSLVPGYPERRQEGHRDMFRKSALLTTLSIAEGDHRQITRDGRYVTDGTYIRSGSKAEIRRREPGDRWRSPGSLASL